MSVTHTSIDYSLTLCAVQPYVLYSHKILEKM